MFISNVVTEVEEMIVRIFHLTHGWNLMSTWSKSIDSFAPLLVSHVNILFCIQILVWRAGSWRQNLENLLRKFCLKKAGNLFLLHQLNLENFIYWIFLPRKAGVLFSCQQMLAIATDLTSEDFCVSFSTPKHYVQIAFLYIKYIYEIESLVMISTFFFSLVRFCNPFRNDINCCC